jgi:hypothetical protein
MFFLLSAALLSGAAAAAPADADTVKMVEFFIKAPVESLPAEHVDEFLAVDPDSLSKTLRTKFKAKRLELYTLKVLAHRKKYGTIISAEENCEVPHEAKSGEIDLLKRVGYQEITEDEEQWVQRKTKCSERKMLCEFTLQIVDDSGGPKNKKRVRRRYFLYCKNACDPLYVLIGAHRAQADGKQTDFFGVGSPVCTQ